MEIRVHSIALKKVRYQRMAVETSMTYNDLFRSHDRGCRRLIRFGGGLSSGFDARSAARTCTCISDFETLRHVDSEKIRGKTSSTASRRGNLLFKETCRSSHRQLVQIVPRLVHLASHRRRLRISLSAVTRCRSFPKPNTRLWNRAKGLPGSAPSGTQAARECQPARLPDPVAKTGRDGIA